MIDGGTNNQRGCNTKPKKARIELGSDLRMGKGYSASAPWLKYPQFEEVLTAIQAMKMPAT